MIVLSWERKRGGVTDDEKGDTTEKVEMTEIESERKGLDKVDEMKTSQTRQWHVAYFAPALIAGRT